MSRPPSSYGRAAFVALGAILFGVPAALGAEELPFVHFTTEHQRVPLPSASVLAVHQDRLGYIWMGFYSSGLGRYDGHGLELYNTGDGLADVTVRDIAEDAQGYLWVGSETGLVVSERPLGTYRVGERVRFRSEVGGTTLPMTRMRHNFFAPDRAGGLWVVTAEEELLRFRITRGRLLERRLTFEAAGSALAVRRDRSVWVATDDGKVAVLRGLSNAPEVLGPENRPGSPVRALHEGPGGTLWAGCRDGSVHRLDEDAVPPRFVPVSTLLKETVTSLLETSQGELWVTSLGSGVLRVDVADPASAQLVGYREGLVSETVWDVLIDHEGSLWLSHNAGISRLTANYRAFGHFTGVSRGGQPPLLPEPSAFSVLPPSAEDPYLWVGTGGGLAALAPDGAATVLDTSDGLTSDSVYSLSRDGAGRIWIGTSKGLNVLTLPGATPSVLPHSEEVMQYGVDFFGLPAELIGFDLANVYATEVLDLPRRRGSAESVWVCGIGGIAVHTGGRWLYLHAAAGLPGSGVNHVAATGDGRVWVGSRDSGILRSREPLFPDLLEDLADGDGEIRTPLFEPLWDRSRGAATDNIHKLLVRRGPPELVWAATPVGLFAFASADGRVVYHLGSQDGGLGGDYVMGLATAPRRGTLWVTQNDGLAEVDPLSGDVLRRVSKLDGLVDGEAWSAYALAVSEDDTVYFATPKGVTAYRRTLDEPVAAEPRLVLRAVEFDDDHSGENGVTFHYATLSFVSEQKVRYKTRLRDRDFLWSEPTTEVRQRYSNLPAYLFPKDYTFEVTATADGRTWLAEPLSYSFRVRPPWWLRWWAALLYAGALAMVIHLWSRQRTRELRERARDLEELFSKRTASVRTHASELETLDQIVQTINREVALEHVMATVLEQGIQLVPQASKGVFSTYDREHDHFEIVATYGWDLGVMTGMTLSVEESMRRYTQEAERLGDGIFIVKNAAAGPGAETMRHVPRADVLLSIEVTLGEQVEGFLVFDIFHGAEELERLDIRTLKRYRQHAISALTKARVLDELEAKNREVEQANRAKSAFLANMSHELRTPLNSIIGFSQILLNRLRGGEARHLKFLQNIHSSGEHLLSLINDILDLSKIEAGHLDVALEEVSVDSVVDGVTGMMKNLAESRGIELRVELPPGLRPVVVDGLKLKQILYNLVSNAIKFSPEGGPVTIGVALHGADTNPLSRDAFEITVADRGIGIAEADQRRIFDEFQQISSSMSREFPGTGLGLALVRRHVQLLGGQVSVDSALGEGSTFRVLLPLRPDKRNPAHEIA